MDGGVVRIEGSIMRRGEKGSRWLEETAPRSRIELVIRLNMSTAEVIVVQRRIGIERGSVVVLDILEVVLGENENERAGEEGKGEKGEKEEEEEEMAA